MQLNCTLEPKFGGNGEEKPSRPIAYSVSFQPCPDPEQRSQDRYVVESWDMPDGAWTFAGVFDGEFGKELLYPSLFTFDLHTLQLALSLSRTCGGSRLGIRA